MNLELLSLENWKELYVFEYENHQEFAEKDTGNLEWLEDLRRYEESIQIMLEDQDNDRAYYYLLKEKNILVGRINIVNVIRLSSLSINNNTLRINRKELQNRGEIEYYIGEKYRGRGYAKEGIRLVLEKAKYVHHLNYMEAGTMEDNVFSQKALLDNGFTYVKNLENEYFFNEKWNDGIWYERIL